MILEVNVSKPFDTALRLSGGNVLQASPVHSGMEENIAFAY